MRMSCTLLVAAATFLANSDVLLAATDWSLIPTPDNLKLVRDTIQNGDNASRFLRAREVANDGTDDVYGESNKEERGKLDRAVSDLSENATNAIKKLTRSKSLSASNLADEIPQLRKFLAGVEDKNNQLFKYIANEMNVDKVTMRDMLNLPEKLKKMSMDEPATYPSFLLWISFKRYIDQSN